MLQHMQVKWQGRSVLCVLCCAMLCYDALRCVLTCYPVSFML